jgi:membrane-associated phospholipid phosphatase
MPRDFRPSAPYNAGMPWMHALMTTVTDIGDPAATLAAAAVLLIGFLRVSRGLAVRWIWAVGACGAAISLIKFVLYSGHDPGAWLWMRSPSGHVAGSALIYGAILLAGAGTEQPLIRLGSAAILLAAIATSRVYLHFHTLLGVMTGLAIGLACLAWFIHRPPDRLAAPRMRAVAILAATACVVVGLLGWQLKIDRVLHAIANHAAGLPPATS